MTEELRTLEEDIEKLCADIRKGIDGLPKMNATDKQNKVAYLNGRVNRVKQLYKEFKLEMRDLSKVEADPWNKKAKAFMDTINKLNQDLTWSQDKDSLTGGANPVAQDPDAMTTQQILEKGEKIQKDDLTSLDRTLQTIEQSKETGVAIGQKLAEQTEQLAKIHEGIHEVNAYLKLASKELRAFARRTATDKLIMGFVCLIVLGIIFIIIWSAVKGKADTSVEQFDPTN